MPIVTINAFVREEIVKPAWGDFKDLTIEDFKAEVMDIVKCSTIGVGQELAMIALKKVDWNHLYKQCHEQYK